MKIDNYNNKMTFSIKKLLYILKIILIQNVLFTIVFTITSYLSGEDIFFTVKGTFITFCYSLGISGLLFFINAICVLFIKIRFVLYSVLTLNVILYVFVFFEYGLHISDAFREILIPIIIAVYGGVFLSMIKSKEYYE